MKETWILMAMLTVISVPSASAQDTVEAPLPRITLISKVDIFDGKTDKLHENRHVQ